MSEKTIVMRNGIGFCGLLFIVLLCLKVGVVPTQVVDWSWWWITAPLWGPTAAAVAMALGIAVFALLAFALVAGVGAVAAIVKGK